LLPTLRRPGRCIVRSGSSVMTPFTEPSPLPGACAVMMTGLLGRGLPVAMSSAWSLWKNFPFSLLRDVSQIVFDWRSMTGVAVMPTSDRAGRIACRSKARTGRSSASRAGSVRTRVVGVECVDRVVLGRDVDHVLAVDAADVERLRVDLSVDGSREEPSNAAAFTFDVVRSFSFVLAPVRFTSLRDVSTWTLEATACSLVSASSPMSSAVQAPRPHTPSATRPAETRREERRMGVG